MTPDLVAILTADVVNSGATAPAAMEAAMQEVAKEIEKAIFNKRKTFEFFRGDSFQALLPKPAEALRIAILWRSGFMARLSGSDLRIAIGIGSIEHRAAKLSLSAGEAFRRSGLLLDELKKNDLQRLAFETPLDAWNEELEITCMLAETIMRRWTPAGAEAVYNQMMYDETQETLASRLGIEQPAVHKRLQVAGWHAIRHWEAHYRNTAAAYLHTL